MQELALIRFRRRSFWAAVVFKTRSKVGLSVLMYLSIFLSDHLNSVYFAKPPKTLRLFLTQRKRGVRQEREDDLRSLVCAHKQILWKNAVFTSGFLGQTYEVFKTS